MYIYIYIYILLLKFNSHMPVLWYQLITDQKPFCKLVFMHDLFINLHTLPPSLSLSLSEYYLYIYVV